MKSQNELPEKIKKTFPNLGFKRLFFSVIRELLKNVILLQISSLGSLSIAFANDKFSVSVEESQVLNISMVI